jgi:hypothetical protein
MRTERSHAKAPRRKGLELGKKVRPSKTNDALGHGSAGFALPNVCVGPSSVGSRFIATSCVGPGQARFGKTEAFSGFNSKSFASLRLGVRLFFCVLA